MSAGAKAEIRLAPPIFLIVTGFEAGFGPVGDFVLHVAGGVQFALRQFVVLGHGFFAGNFRGAIASTALQNFQAEPATFVNFHHVDGNVFRPQSNRFLQRLAPRSVRLLGQAGDQIEADIADSCGAQNGHGAVDVFAAVHAARGFQFAHPQKTANQN